MPTTPPGRFTLGTKTTIEKLLQTNPDVALYEDTKRAMLATLARSLGEKGVLTDLDIARIKSALPQVAWEENRPPDTQEVARRKMGTLKGLITEFQKRAIQNYSGAIGSQSQSPSNDPEGLRQFLK